MITVPRWTAGWLAGSRAASARVQVPLARSLARSFPRLKPHPGRVRRAACLVPIGRIISNCQDTTTTSIPYGAAYSRWSSRYEAPGAHRDGAPRRTKFITMPGDLHGFIITSERGILVVAFRRNSEYPSLTFNHTSLRRARTMRARIPISYYITAAWAPLLQLFCRNSQFSVSTIAELANRPRGG